MLTSSFLVVSLELLDRAIVLAHMSLDCWHHSIASLWPFVMLEHAQQPAISTACDLMDDLGVPPWSAMTVCSSICPPARGQLKQFGFPRRRYPHANFFNFHDFHF